MKTPEIIKDKIILRFIDLYGRHCDISQYVKIGDEIITFQGDYFCREKIVHIYAGVIFYNIIKLLKKGETEWKDVKDEGIYHFAGDSLYALSSFPTEINIFDWFEPSILNKYKPNDLYGGIKINYRGFYEDLLSEETLKYI